MIGATILLCDCRDALNGAYIANVMLLAMGFV